MQARHPSEEAANQLYGKLRLCSNSKRRQELMEAEFYKPNGMEKLRNTKDLLAALIKVEEKAIWDKCCDVPEYPGNQEDIDTINFIDKQIYQLKNGPVILLLKKLNSELIALLNTQQQMFESYAHLRFDSLKQCQSLQEISDTVDELLNDMHGADILKSTSALFRANMRVMKISDNGEYEKYEQIIKIIGKALNVANSKGNDEVAYSPTLYQPKRLRRSESVEILFEDVKSSVSLI
jgi:hypothetical protein